MWYKKTVNKESYEVLKLAQSNLESAQQNTELVGQALTKYLEKNDKTKNIDSIDAIKAAYALNLCTVSVSQIIDYNDIYFLEREYDAILNNLNLEEMPKDEALLRILKQLLDVISFFRIQEGERRMMEQEYEQRMKDAVWSAIPNPGMIVANGSPIAIAVSLASQVGIGYMNYRKEKAKIGLDKERKEWELQRSAMEQFHGLRRELFDTAWRLADEYNFPDEYRITERQIKQYNDILLDLDDLRRYERLDYIKDCFQAYPPFWYYIGNAANAVSQDKQYPNSIREEFRNKAREHFRYFFGVTEKNLLREDQLVASCALELFDIVDDKQEKLMLLDKAKKASGNAFDVLQICAISYLKIGEVDKSCDLLKMLVNENYNVILNAQLLSRIYVSGVIGGEEAYRDKYIMLQRRMMQPQYLFPMPEELPETEEDKEELLCQFTEMQKTNLLYEYAEVMRCYIDMCENKYECICRLDGDILSEMADFILSMSEAIDILLGEKVRNTFMLKVKESIDVNKDFEKMLQSGNGRKQGLFNLPFSRIFVKAFEEVAVNIRMRLLCQIAGMEGISGMQSALCDFRVKEKIEDGNYGYIPNAGNAYSISEIFGDCYSIKHRMDQLIDECTEELKKCGKGILVDGAKDIEFMQRDDLDFEPYAKRNQLNADVIVAVLNDKTLKDLDLIFTLNRIYVHKWISIKASCEYKEAHVDSNGLSVDGYKYKESRVNFTVLKNMIELMAKYGEMYAKECLKENGEQSLADVIFTRIHGTV